jgi:hypothetical protein
MVSSDAQILINCLEQEGSPEADDVASRILDAAKEKEACGDLALGQSLRLIAGVFSLPVARMGRPVGPDGIWIDPVRLTERELDILASSLPHLKYDDAIARVADTLWIRAKDWRAGTAAVEAYLRRARTIEGLNNWYESAERYVRATNLAASLNRRGELYRRCVEEVFSVLRRVNGDDPGFLSLRLMELLVEHRIREYAPECAGFATKAARRAEEQFDFWRAENYWIIKMRWQDLVGGSVGGNDAREEYAECLVKQARSRAAGPSPSYSVAADFLERGITVLRKIGGKRDRVRELLLELKKYESNVGGELKRISVAIDVTDLGEAARNVVSGKALTEALRDFAMVAAPPRLADLRAAVKNLARGFISESIALSIIDREGAVVATRPPIDPEGADDDAVRKRMIEHANIIRKVTVEGSIMPAATQILEEHLIRVEDLLPLVTQSAWVPPGRESVYARGIFAGLDGDLTVAIHLLLPQLENSLRWLLQAADVPTVTFRPDDHQVQQPFGELLFSPEAKVLLGEDLHFDLVSLLVEPSGPNLRNQVAHGRVPTNEFNSVAVMYCWWLTLRLCFLTIPR